MRSWCKNLEEMIDHLVSINYFDKKKFDVMN